MPIPSRNVRKPLKSFLRAARPCSLRYLGAKTRLNRLKWYVQCAPWNASLTCVAIMNMFLMTRQRPTTITIQPGTASTTAFAAKKTSSQFPSDNSQLGQVRRNKAKPAVVTTNTVATEIAMTRSGEVFSFTLFGDQHVEKCEQTVSGARPVRVSSSLLAVYHLGGCFRVHTGHSYKPITSVA